MTDDSNIIDLQKRRSESAADEARLLSDAIRNGFHIYADKYRGRFINEEMIFELCSEICIDALRVMRGRDNIDA
jgi:hypothetical protein